MSIYQKIEKALAVLPDPQIVEVKSFDEYLAELVTLAKEVLGSDWQPLESDPYMKKLRVLALRKMHDQADKNHTIREMLLTTATGAALDHKALGRAVVRDEGEYPWAKYRFELSAALDHPITIPQGTRLNSDDDVYQAEVMEELTIPAGDEHGETRVQLMQYVPSSDITITNIVTQLPFVAEAVPLELFHDGDGLEEDERLRLRAITALARASTAGDEESYKWYAYGADSRIRDVYVTSVPRSLIVDIYVYADAMDQAMLDRVAAACNPKHIRPLSDKVEVHAATVKPLEITATIEVFDLLQQGRIAEEIKGNFEESFGLGVDLVRSDFDRKCHVNGVYRVVTDQADISVEPHEVIRITGYNLTFVGVDHV